MNRFILVALLAIADSPYLQAQQPSWLKPGMNGAKGDLVAAPQKPRLFGDGLNLPEPLTCGKYQHVDSPPMYCGDVSGPYGGNMCYPPHCVDDMHLVTEREWQAIQDRLDASVKLAALMHEDQERLLERLKKLEEKK